MPSTRDHLAQARRNQGVIDYLLDSPTPYPDWVATVAFYKAVHLVDALLSTALGLHPHDHRAREQALKMERRHENVCRHYLQLKSISIIARYLREAGGKGYQQFGDFMDVAAVKDQILGHLLHQIEASVTKLISRAPAARRKRKH